MLASYEADFAASWGRAVRNNFDDYRGILTTRISDDMASSSDWKTTSGGGMKTAGAGGPLTGAGADLGIVDDVVKNAEEASSQTIRDKIWDWWATTFYTRLEPGANLICLMTRWNQDDLVGRLLQQMEDNKKQGIAGDNWEVYNFPAIAYGLGEKDGVPVRDAIGRKDGDALWPERYPIEALKKIRAAVREGPWNALYQQTPTPPDGDFFKRQHIEECKYEIEDVRPDVPDSGTVVLISDNRKLYYPISEMTTFLVADTAMTEKKENDATCIGIWWITPRRHLVLKAMWHGRMRGPQVEQKIHEMYKEHHCLFMAIENKANGITAIQKFMDMAVSVKPLKAVSDKVTRATPLQSMFEQHRVWLPVDLPYWSEVWTEFLKFPKGKHDDIVDMMAHAAIVLSEQTYDTDGPPVVIDAETEAPDEISLI